MNASDLVRALSVASTLLALSLVFVVVEGALTLVLHRAQVHASLWSAIARTPSPVAHALDVVGALVTTACGCASHAAVHALAPSQERRAVFVLSLAAAVRVPSMALFAVVVVQSGLATAGVAFAVVIVWSALVARALGARAIAPGSVFVARISRAPVSRALVDAVEETREMWRLYAPHLIGCALAAGAATLAPQTWFVDVRIWPALVVSALVGAFVRVDFLALGPLVVVLVVRGVPAVLLLPLALGADVCAVRTLRLLHGYLRFDRAPTLAVVVPVLPALLALTIAVSLS